MMQPLLYSKLVLLTTLLAGSSFAAPQWETWPVKPAALETAGARASQAGAEPPAPTTESGGGSATAPPSTTAPAGGEDDDACATVASLVASATAAVPTIPADVAYACQRSVPFDQAAAVPWLETFKPYIAWQSTTSYLIDPPSGYLEPAVDVNGTLDGLIAKAQAGAYANEYDFEFDIYRLFQTTHDGHFRYTPNLVASIFTYGRTIPLVSVSSDGTSLPQIYVYADVLAQSLNGTQASAVTQINGQDAAAYLETLSQFGSLQDPDALYNNLFYELAQISLGGGGTGTGIFGGGGRGAYVYPNATTMLTFANGTTSTYANFARVLKDFTGIATGSDLYTRYVNPPSPTSSTSTSSAALTSTPAPGYPTPVIRNARNLVAGYYVEQPGYEDVAVLSIPNFVSDGTQEQPFQDVVTQFLKQSKADGKEKLIVDVSANAGGTILQGYDVFKQLFPDLLPYGGNRFRAFETTDLMGQVVSEAEGPVYPWDLDDPANFILDDFLGTPFPYLADLNEAYKPSTSWPDKFGPHAFNNDFFSSIIRWNVSDCNTIYTAGIYITGYCNRTDTPTERPYAPEDIIVVYDGYCASTCTIFSEFMRQQGDIKTIALGGRPTEGIIQAVGGTKGTNNYDWDTIFYFVNDTLALANETYREYLEGTELGQYSEYPLNRALNNYAVNFRDGIRQGDETQTPLQFVYEPADCRIYYTADMTTDVTVIWKTVYDSVWGGKSACVAGDVSVTPSSNAKKPKRNEYKLRKRANAAAVAELRDSIGSVWTDVNGARLGDAWMSPY